MRPACQSSRPLPFLRALGGVSSAQNSSRTRVSGALPCHTPHDPGSTPSLGSIRRPGMEGQPVQQQRPCQGQGRRAGRRPTSSLRRAPSALCSLVSCSRLDHGPPRPRLGAAATRCQTPWGAEPYTSMLALPCCPPALHFRKSCTLRTPPPPPGSLAALGVVLRTRDSHLLAPRPCPSCTGGPAPAHFPDRGGCVFVEVPAGPLGSWAFSSPAALFYLCFCLQMGVGSSGGRAVLPPRVTRGLWLEPSTGLDSTFPCPTKDHTVK